MASFTGPSSGPAPFGVNEYLRSTQDVKKESYTVAAAAVAVETIDGFAQKVLQPGELMAKITSGPDAGKVGPYDASATDGRQTAANIVGLNDTFLPWQLLERDVEIAVTYEATVVQGWCFERATGVRTVLSNTAVTALLGASLKGVKLSFK